MRLNTTGNLCANCFVRLCPTVPKFSDDLPCRGSDGLCLAGQLLAERAKVQKLREALARELDACFCDDRDGNSNPPHNPECERCVRIRRALSETEGP